MRLKQKASAKIHRRYILISGADRKTIEKIVLDYIGILGWAAAALVFVNDEKIEKGNEIIAIERKSLENVRAAFEISNEKVKIIRVSGTLKGLRK